MVGSNQFYAAFAGAKPTAFFCRACMERTMQLRDDVAVGLRQNDVQQYLCSQLAAAGDISLFEKGEQPLLFLRCAVEGARGGSGGFNGGAERGFVQRLLGKDHGLALGMRGRDLIHRKRTAHGVIDMGFAHGTCHAAYFYGRLDHIYTFFQEHLIKL